eukprot:8516491-Alexandrium_andersonii.AAC.1
MRLRIWDRRHPCVRPFARPVAVRAWFLGQRTSRWPRRSSTAAARSPRPTARRAETARSPI